MSSLAAAAIVLVLAAGAVFFLTQGGVLEKDVFQSPGAEGPSEEESGEIVEEGELEQSENNLHFKLDGKDVVYPTLFPNPRWNHMPLTYYMDESSGEGLAGFGEDDPEYVRQAMRVWEEKTRGTISFEEVGSKDGAEIVISWFPSLTAIEGGRVVGEGGPTRAVQTGGKYTLLAGGEIFLLPTDSKCVGVNRPVHEMGHVLGLGHAPPGHADIMFSKEVDCRQNITEVTMDAIEMLYREPALADLVITNVSSVRRGEYMDVNLTVRNVGLRDSVQTSLGFFVGGEIIESLTAPSFSVVPSISPGGGISSKITNAKLPKGAKEVTIRADWKGEVAESDEQNNEATVRFS